MYKNKQKKKLNEQLGNKCIGPLRRVFHFILIIIFKYIVFNINFTESYNKNIDVFY